MLERNEKLGKKLYITGKGRCNLTNLCDREEFLRSVPRNARFLYSALDFLSPDKLCAWFESLGCPTETERGNRVYPLSRKASDVTRALSRGLSEHEVRLNTRVASLICNEERVLGVITQNGERLEAGQVIIASGGLSYPLTGSTGDGYKLAQSVGHTVTALSPALTGLETREKWALAAQGLSLKNVRLRARYQTKTLLDEQGELLFTHFGISGPLGLSLSSLISGLPLEKVTVSLDLKPALNTEQLLARLRALIAENGKKQWPILMKDFLPMSLMKLWPMITEIDPEIQAGQLDAPKRARICECMKSLPLQITALRPYEEAVITRGGVAVKEISPSSMASKIKRGLFFAGEVLDVDALTGGFNLQIAFSTGALAGYSAANSSD